MSSPQLAKVENTPRKRKRRNSSDESEENGASKRKMLALVR
jgi:hypothetical protein